MDIEAIAKRLTPAQRGALLTTEEIVIGEQNCTCNEDTLYELALDGLADDYMADNLTDLGLAVREYLIKEGK